MIIRLLASFLPPFAVAAIGGLATASKIPTWYAALNKPSFNPPNWIFGPVWTTLYFLMGLSFYLAWPKLTRLAIAVFAIQLGLNLAWSLVFFGAENTGAALVVIALLWVMIVVNIVVFWRLNPVSGALLVPYLLWVSFASLLNYQLWRLNP